MTYTVWRDDSSDLFLPGTDLPACHRHTSPGLAAVHTIEARSHNEAMRKYHEWQGWEPYKPMLAADGRPYPEDEGESP